MGVDLDAVWNTIEEIIPPMRIELESIVHIIADEGQ